MNRARLLRDLAALLKARSGLVIGPDKLYLLETRLAPIVQARRACATSTRWPTGCGGPARETLAHAVVEAMTTNESFFFRDDKPFAAFPRAGAAAARRGAAGRSGAAGLVGRLHRPGRRPIRWR